MSQVPYTPDAQRADRRASMRNLINRAAPSLTPDEDALLRQHVEAEIREADQWRAGRHTMKQRGEEIERDRDRLAAELEDAEQRASGFLAERDQARAALARVQALADEYPVGIDTALIHAALDCPTEETSTT